MCSLVVWEDWIKARRVPLLLNVQEFPTVDRDIMEMDVDEMYFWLPFCWKYEKLGNKS